MSDGENQLWAAYVRAIAGDVSAQSVVDRIAERVGSGVSQPTVSRWLNGRYSGELKPGNVAAFATAYDRPVLEGFLAAGLLTAADVEKGLDQEAIAFVLKLDREATRVRRQSKRSSRAPRRQPPRPPQA